MSIAHTITEDSALGKRSKPIIFANLGEEANLDEKHVGQLLRSLEKYAAKRWGNKAPTARQVKAVAREVRAQEPIGPRKSTLGQAVLSEVKGRFSAHPTKPHMTYKSLVFDPDQTKSGAIRCRTSSPSRSPASRTRARRARWRPTRARAGW